MTRSARHDALTAGDSASGAATTVSVSTAVATVESGGDVTGLASARGVAAGGIAIAAVAGVVTTVVTPGAAMTVKTAVARAAAWTGTVCGTCLAFGRFLGVPGSWGCILAGTVVNRVAHHNTLSLPQREQSQHWCHDSGEFRGVHCLQQRSTQASWATLTSAASGKIQPARVEVCPPGSAPECMRAVSDRVLCSWGARVSGVYSP